MFSIAVSNGATSVAGLSLVLIARLRCLTLPTVGRTIALRLHRPVSRHPLLFIVGRAARVE
jgi:hypothetical protein